MPWLRPMHGVSRCSCARRRSAARTASRSARIRSAARPSWMASVVSSRSDEVRPRCRNLASSPQICSTWVRNAMTSCRVVASISSTRPGSIRRSRRAAALATRVRTGSAGIGADRRHGLGRGQLDVEPDAEPGLGREDRRHLGSAVARDHGLLSMGDVADGGPSSSRPTVRRALPPPTAGIDRMATGGEPAPCSQAVWARLRSLGIAATSSETPAAPSAPRTGGRIRQGGARRAIGP